MFDASFNAFGSHPKTNLNTFLTCDVKEAVKNFREAKNMA